MKEFFKELFTYSHHYNQKLSLIFSENQDSTSEKSLKLFNHILNAHQIWNSRINPTQPSFGVWDLHLLNTLTAIDNTNYEQTLQILDKFPLDDILNYTSSKGDPFSNSVRDILFHVINHSTYHRGQIAIEFRNQGMTPLNTDFVFYKR